MRRFSQKTSSFGDVGRKRPCWVYLVREAGTVGERRRMAIATYAQALPPSLLLTPELECGSFLAGCEARLSVQRLALLL